MYKALEIADPWDKKHKDRLKLAVCGDDVVIQFRNEIDATRVREYIESINCPKGIATVNGLGQTIKCELTSLDNLSFCSKYMTLVGTKAYMVPNLRKVIFAKTVYSGHE